MLLTLYDKLKNELYHEHSANILMWKLHLQKFSSANII